jgi:tetratricopeptide (TPR) repeat protein
MSQSATTANTPAAQAKPPRNQLLEAARRRLPSPAGAPRPMSRQELAEAVNHYLWTTHQTRDNLDRGDIGAYERGEIRWPNDGRREAFRVVLGAAHDHQLGFYTGKTPQPPTAQAAAASPPAPTDPHPGRTRPEAAAEALQRPRPDSASRDQHPDSHGETRSEPHQVELLRRGLNDTLTEGVMAEASLDDWDRTVLRYGRATRDRSAGTLLGDLSADLAELTRALGRHRSASALRRLTRAVALMSGLMCLTFCKLDDRPSFRRWARTARLAADEAGDPEIRSWVLAQEAYGHYYSADLVEAMEVAQHAQAVGAANPCVGAALAAALEARVAAVMGQAKETRATLGRAEEILSHLGGEALTPSAFGYNEAQFRFHEGNALTHLGDERPAFKAQDRALALCAPGDYTDWAMTRLDRARCLTTAGDAAAAVEYATETLTALSEPKRRGIITLRGHEILNALPHQQQATPAARDLRDLLLLTTEQER